MTTDEFQMALHHCQHIIRDYQRQTATLERSLEKERVKNADLVKAVEDFQTFMKAKYPIEYQDVENKRFKARVPPKVLLAEKETEETEVTLSSEDSDDLFGLGVLDEIDIDNIHIRTGHEQTVVPKKDWELNEKDLLIFDHDGLDSNSTAPTAKSSTSTMNPNNLSCMAALEAEPDHHALNDGEFGEHNIEVSSTVSSLGSQSAGRQASKYLFELLRKSWLESESAGKSMEIPQEITFMHQERLQV